MAQVTGDEVQGNGDHVLTFDDGTTKTVSGSKLKAGASWGDALHALGLSEGTPAAGPKTLG